MPRKQPNKKKLPKSGWINKIRQHSGTPYLFVLVVCIVFGLLIYWVQGNSFRLLTRKSYEKNSTYAGIKSRFVNDRQWHVQSQREYPITENETINYQLSQQIDNIHQTFIDRSKKAKHKFRQKDYSENISYSVTYNRNQLLSISVNTLQKIDGTNYEISTSPQTFDLKTGTLVKLTDIWTDQNYFTNKVMPDLRHLVVKEIQSILPDFTDAQLDQKIIEQNTNNFLIQTDGSIQFEFAPKQFNLSYVSKLIINLQATEYILNIKPAFAKRMFDQATIDLNSPESPKNRGSFCSNHPCVAITFDDGPSYLTNRLLDILRDNNVKATFFILGKNAEGHQDIVKRQINEGHQIGYHGWGHTAFTKLSPTALDDELNHSDAMIKQAGDYTVKLTRPPYGLFNSNVVNQLRNRNQSVIMWSVDPRDWDIKDSPQVYNRVVTATHNGAIILLHDIHPTTIDAVEPIINQLKNSGYYFVTVNTLLGDNLTPGRVYYKR